MSMGYSITSRISFSYITWKPDNTLEVASSNGHVHVSNITGVSFANYLLVKDNPKLLKLIEKRAVSL